MSFLLAFIIALLPVNPDNTSLDILLCIRKVDGYCNHGEDPIIALYEGTITNAGEESYYTWIDFTQDYHIEECDRLARIYLCKPFGDFSLLQLLSEEMLFCSGFTPSIGKTFLKRIEPGSSFKYFVDRRICDNLEKHIFYISETDIKKIVPFMLNDQIVLFDQDEIVISLAQDSSVSR